MKPLVYVAAPYTHPDPVENTHTAIKAGMRIFESGLAVPIIPHLSLTAHLVQPREPDYWYAFDLAQLDHCNALVRLPGESVGADREVECARQIPIPIFDDDEGGDPVEFLLIGIRNGLVECGFERWGA